jgi:hypothetical protein
MAKRIYSTVLDHSSNAGWQAWATELFDESILAGLVQAADTGQLTTPVTTPRPATNTSGGYWILRLDDALQATAPIFIRVEPGTSSGGASFPRILVTIGTGTNGAGTITGTILSSVQFTYNAAPASTVTPYTTYINHDEGFFGLAFKSGANPNGSGFLAFNRTTNDDTTPNGNGYFIVHKTSPANANAAAVCGIFGGASFAEANKNWCMVPFSITSSTAGSDFQAFKVYGVYPAARIVPQLVVVVAGELAMGNTTGALEIVDGVTHDYISVGVAGSACTVSNNAATYNFAMLWD